MTIREGKMFIAIEKQISKPALDNFIRQYELADLGLYGFVFQNKTDSLMGQGWKVVLRDNQVFIISKDIQPVDEKFLEPWQRINSGNPIPNPDFPSVNRLQIGYNQMRSGTSFAVKDSSVRFYLRGYPNAKQVILAGTFNDWSPEALQMKKAESGWEATVNLKPGKHQYKFIIDGTWITDPDNKQNENDGMGNTNSVYYLPNHVFKLEGYPDAKHVMLAGSFNDWRETEIELQREATGWQLPVWLSEGTHTYRFIVDRNWIEDPANPDKFPNEFGEFNSVVRIGQPRLFKLDGYTNAKNVFLVGSFNRWRGDEIPMRRTANGWEVNYTLGSGNYEYHFRVDEQIVPDPNNPPNETNVKNSQLILNPNHEFRLKGHGKAKKVMLAGDFNNWSESTAMQKVGDDWVLRVHLSPGKHLYKFIVDGNWIIDPGNRLWEDNEHGSGNSVIWIGESP